MKKLIYGVLAIMMSIALFSQSNDLAITGQVTYEEAPNPPAASQAVTISGPALNDSITVLTDIQGFYTVSITNGSVIGPNQIYTVSVMNCNNQMLTQQVSNQQGTVDFVTVNFQICGWQGGCEAFFTSSTNPNQPNTFVFDASSSVGNDLTYTWDFGDGTTATGQNIQHVFTTAGDYYVCLNVNNAAGNCTNTYCDTITVGQFDGCQAFFVYDQLNGTPTLVLNANQSFGNISSYQWQVDGLTVASTPVLTLPFNNYGTYTICLTVNSIGGCSDTYCQTITLINNNSNCNLSFMWQPSFVTPGTTVEFINQSTGYNNFQWSVNNANVSSQNNLVHTFTQPGIYQICLSAISNNQCPANSYCSSITVVGEPNCSAAFDIVPLNNTSGSFDFIPEYQGPTVMNIWYYTYEGLVVNFLPPHNFPAPGLYNVCHEVIDSLNQCYQIECATVLVGGNSNPCQATFNFQQTSPANNLGYTFTPSQANANTFEFIWYFGDGNSSTAFAPEHVYNSPGIYNVCLFLWNTATGCQASSCNTIVVVSPDSSGTASIDGMVYAGNNLADFGFAYLIKYDQGSNSLNLVALAAVNNGYYMFQNVEPGQYLIKAALDYNSAFYANYLPTYFGSHLYWADAQPVMVSGSTNNNYVISLIFGNNPGGPGFVAGNVDDGANRLSEDAMNPVAMADIILLDDNNVPQMWTKASYNGSYSLSNIAYGTYRMFADVPGMICIPIEFTISPDFPNLEIDIVLGEGLTFIIRNEQEVKVGLLYPNPASEMSMVNISNFTNQQLMIQLYDIQGRMMKQVSVGNAAEQLISIPLSDLSSGIYQMLILHNGTAIANRKLVVTRP